MIHESESLQAEKNFFLALNARKGISADVIVKSWTGPGAALVIDAAHNSAHPIFDDPWDSDECLFVGRVPAAPETCDSESATGLGGPMFPGDWFYERDWFSP